MTKDLTPVDPLAPRIVFLHIAKTAGTSLVEYLRNRLPPDSVLSHGDFLDLPGQELPLDLMSRYRLISGHFGYSQVQHFLADSYSLTFLRDPLARALSLYKYLLHPGMQARFEVARAATALPIDAFFTSTRPEVVEMLDNQQTWQLADNYWTAQRQHQPRRNDTEILALAKAHLQEFTLVGFTDSFASDFHEVIKAAGLPEPSRVPQQLLTQDPILPEQLKDSTVDTLKQRMALDYELVNYARGLQ